VAKVCGVIMGLGVIGSANQGVGMWKWCFWSMAALGFLGLVLMWLWLPGTPKEEGLPDLPGTERQGEGALPTGTDDNVARAPSPLPDDRQSMARMVFLNPVIWMLGLCNFAINAARALVADWGPTLLQEAKGLSSSDAGTVIMLFEFAGIAGMLFAGWATDRLFGGRAPRLCVFLMALTAGLLAAFWFLPTGGWTKYLAMGSLCLAGFCLYGPQALTGVTATNTSTKVFAGTSIGFISLFSYIGVSVSGKVCGSLAQASHGWFQPVMAIVGVAAVGCALFVCLWNVRANSYGGK
jgi:OPA family glycerol-3-phosphate transporter-like MFS transporter/OPA family sugar phosphate sensor protein UhpC-like MFS transporter